MNANSSFAKMATKWAEEHFDKIAAMLHTERDELHVTGVDAMALARARALAEQTGKTVCYTFARMSCKNGWTVSLVGKNGTTFYSIQRDDGYILHFETAELAYNSWTELEAHIGVQGIDMVMRGIARNILHCLDIFDNSARLIRKPQRSADGAFYYDTHF